MGLLKKIKASSLIETSIASAIIIAVFMMGSLILNNVFGFMIKKEDSSFQNRAKEIQYLLENNQLKLPFFEETDLWDFYAENNAGIIVLETTNKMNDKTQSIKVYPNE